MFKNYSLEIRASSFKTFFILKRRISNLNVFVPSASSDVYTAISFRLEWAEQSGLLLRSAFVDGCPRMGSPQKRTSPLHQPANRRRSDTAIRSNDEFTVTSLGEEKENIDGASVSFAHAHCSFLSEQSSWLHPASEHYCLFNIQTTVIFCINLTDNNNS